MWPGDVIVIPAGIADEIAKEVVEMTAFEGFLTEILVKQGRSILGLYPPTEQRSKDDFVVWMQTNSKRYPL